jgi:Oxidoreductase molybdopterin binding domain
LLGALLLPVGGLPPASAQDVIIAHSVEQAHAVGLTAVTQLPKVERSVSFLTSHGADQATYTGALLWSLLQRQGILPNDPTARVRRTVVVTGRDGYVAVLALAEIDPEFEGKPVLLAFQRDNQPLPDNELRLVVPGDHRGGRSVRGVARIELQ